MRLTTVIFALCASFVVANDGCIIHCNDHYAGFHTEYTIEGWKCDKSLPESVPNAVCAVTNFQGVSLRVL